jgi:hypothetical protein
MKTRDEKALTLLRQIVKHLDACYSMTNGPGHDHLVAGRWDDDGGPCKWCILWNRARRLVKKGGIPK